MEDINNSLERERKKRLSNGGNEKREKESKKSRKYDNLDDEQLLLDSLKPPKLRQKKKLNDGN